MSLRDYFSNNKIFTGTEKPTQGKFSVGDIIVNIGPNSAEEPMWICVEAGTPGVWELCSGVNEEEIADIVQANALSAIDYTDGVDIQIDGGNIGDMNELQTTDKSSIVGAINELFQSANNGKELIANAIGEPLNAEDTFSAMSSDINGLLSTFKTNMMNSGVMVESSDKFKQLIEKIKGLTEGEGNKGVQFASGIIENLPSGSEPFITIDLNFKAEFIIINSYSDYLGINNPDSSGYIVAYEGDAGLIRGANSIAFYPKGTASGSAVLYNFLTDTLFSNCYVNDIGFRLPIYEPYNNKFNKPNNPTDVRYVAIGVGEEDTTLRDSLASILQEEGVSVTEEDDMASLITKVDEEFTKDNNTISEIEANNEINRNKLYNLMLDIGYEIDNNMNMSDLLDLLEVSDISIRDVKQIACGYNHTVVLKTDGTVWACGDNQYGQLGLGDLIDRSTFVQVPNITNAQQVSCGYYHTFIIIDTSTVYSAGHNAYGQLGLGNNLSPVSTFTQVTTNVSNVKKIVCGDGHSVMVRTGGGLYCCGKNDKGQCAGSGLNTFTRVSTNINYEVDDAACGPNFTFVKKYDGSLWACGSNEGGGLGLGASTYYTQFTKLNTNISGDIKQISCGICHTMILTNDGVLWACGINSSGQIGTVATNTGYNKFTQISTGIKQVSCGNVFTYIIKNDNSLWATGADYSSGVLGLNLSGTHTINGFTQITANVNNDVKEVICDGSYQHVFIIKNDGVIMCCGLNDKGQLGIGNTSNKNVFTNIPKGF